MAFFAALSHPCIIVNENRRTEKNRVGLGTRLRAHASYPTKNMKFKVRIHSQQCTSYILHQLCMYDYKKMTTNYLYAVFVTYEDITL